jgi:hypothetical protein
VTSPEIVWLVLVIVVWLIIAALVGFGLAKVIRARDRQIATHTKPGCPPDDRSP